MPQGPATHAYPSDHAWLWDRPGVGDCMLSRREAAVVDVMARHPMGPMRVAEVKEAFDAAMALPPPAGHRGILARAGDAALGALAAAGTMSLPALHAVVASLGDKGLVAPTGDKVFGPGRASRSWALTDAGRAAASLVAAMGRAAVDLADPDGVGQRLADEALDAVLSAPSLQGVLNSDADGYRLEAAVGDRYATVARGTPGVHDAIVADIGTRLRSPPGRYPSFPYRWPARPDVELRVEVTSQPHLLGMRTLLTFVFLPDTRGGQGGSDRAKTP